MMYEVLSDPDLHIAAVEGYKKVEQLIDLNGQEDLLVVREAGTYWNEETSDGYANMRQTVNAEMTAVAELFADGDITWNQTNVRSLICKCPPNRWVDNGLKHMGDLFRMTASTT